MNNAITSLLVEDNEENCHDYDDNHENQAVGDGIPDFCACFIGCLVEGRVNEINVFNGIELNGVDGHYDDHHAEGDGNEEFDDLKMGSL